MAGNRTPAMTHEPIFSLTGKRIWVAGHTGMVGAAVLRRLEGEGCELATASRAELDLRRQADVEAWMAAARPDVVVLAAATVGGILANAARPAEFLYDNLAIETNVIGAARKTGVEKLLFLGSSCIYPKLAPQPMSEEALLTGPLEPTNEWYAIAKIAGLKLCQAFRREHGCDFIAAMPTNLFGPGDSFDLQRSHVAAALIMKVHRAKAEGLPSIEIWGTGTPRREFLYVEDLADALVFLLKTYSDERPINVGVGEDLSIIELARLVAETAGWSGDFITDPSKPDGAPRKLLDVSRMTALGWKARTPLKAGLRRAYDWYVEHGARA